ncbi:LytTR family transcriptional regulator [Aquimarina sp. TRL1]|uniref:LytTR family DNA-binding domain-containing protein n=1 Tax=Aquimarina sp. (strain TRL1) TaxID=2736252 RepID=UPI00158C62EE|nr:LytTR family DNA-binding domain-containing protein [Aquimarina sp. TRL1]QKX06669.1 LytTR family transcriptional regulator [Aquimarina sp. TRL1]
MKKLNPSIKHHLLIGLFITLWGFLFAFIIRPFDDGTLNLEAWIKISIGFNAVSFITYGILSILQNRIYHKIKKWNIGLEISSILFYYMLYTICNYLIYKSPFLNGGYNFTEFCLNITLKAAFVLLPIVLVIRYYSIRLIPVKEDTILIKGENKLDILKIKQSELISISNAQNYVEIFFIQDNKLASKLIRSSLKKIENDILFLVKIHRSHLINPMHFKSWKDANTISLTFMELPVSKNYKKNLSEI